MSSAHESLDRHHLELLTLLAHDAHLGRAAQQLNISASAASHRLAEAERRLGADLTIATGRTIELTPAARHVAEVGEVALRSLRAAEETARWMGSTERAAVRLAIDFYDTAPWFEQLPDQPRLPVPVDFVRVGYGDVTDAVAQRRADLGVHLTAHGDAHGDAPELADHLVADELVAVVADDHPAALRGVLEPADTPDEVYFTAGDRPAPGFEHHGFFEPAGVRPRRLQKAESLAMILRLIRRHGGVSIEPSLALRDAPLHGLRVVPLADTKLRVDWRFIARVEPTDGVDDLIDVIRSLVDTPRVSP